MRRLSFKVSTDYYGKPDDRRQAIYAAKPVSKKETPLESRIHKVTAPKKGIFQPVEK